MFVVKIENAILRHSSSNSSMGFAPWIRIGSTISVYVWGGTDIRDARKRRKIPLRVMAERALISPTTLTRIEGGTLARPSDSTQRFYSRSICPIG